MKIKAIRQVICVCAALFAGCAATPELDLASIQYTVNAVILEYEDNFQARKQFDKEGQTDPFSSTNGVIIHRLPEITLRDGQSRQTDMREMLDYEEHFNFFKKKNEPFKAGWLFYVTLHVPEAERPHLKIVFENTEVKTWKEFTGRDGKKYRYPVRTNKRLETVAFPDLGKWLRIVDSSGVTRSGRYDFFIRLDIEDDWQRKAMESAGKNDDNAQIY